VHSIGITDRSTLAARLVPEQGRHPIHFGPVETGFFDPIVFMALNRNAPAWLTIIHVADLHQGSVDLNSIG
jgi:hypothetical protein